MIQVSRGWTPKPKVGRRRPRRGEDGRCPGFNSIVGSTNRSRVLIRRLASDAQAPCGFALSASGARAGSPAMPPSTRRASCAVRPRARRGALSARLRTRRCRRYPPERRARSTSAAGLGLCRRSVRRRLRSSRPSADEGLGSIFRFWPQDFSLVSFARLSRGVV